MTRLPSACVASGLILRLRMLAPVALIAALVGWSAPARAQSPYSNRYKDTTAPTLTTPANQVAEATASTGAVVSYPAPTASDAVGVTSLSCIPASGSTFGIAATTVTCTAKDAAGNTATKTFTVKVQDKTAPTIKSLTLTPGSWRPTNHKMVNVTIDVSATDAVTTNPPCAITKATSSEPDSGLGDGDTAGDIGPIRGLSINLRAERGGNGPGRIYTLEVTCSDAASNKARVTTTVTLPKSQGQ